MFIQRRIPTLGTKKYVHNCLLVFLINLTCFPINILVTCDAGIVVIIVGKYGNIWLGIKKKNKKKNPLFNSICVKYFLWDFCPGHKN